MAADEQPEWASVLAELTAFRTVTPAEFEECRVGRFETSSKRIFDVAPFTVEHADPAVLIGVDLLVSFMSGASPHVTYDAEHHLVQFEAENGRWVYKVMAALPNRRVFCMRWPD